MANLDPGLRRALRQAATATNGAASSSSSAGRGPDPYLNSGWRSARYQTQLLDRAITDYEFRPEAKDHGCPAMYDDPTRDPRMQG